jgi:hypothetical protein
MPKQVIRVTQDLIDGAKREDSSHCMIAEALKVALPEATHISVDLATIRYTDRKRRRRIMILTPPPAQVGLLMFDQADPNLVPFEFNLPAPAQIVAMQTPPKKALTTHPKADTSTSSRAKRRSSGVATKADTSARRKRQMPTLGPTNGKKIPAKLGGTLPPLGSLRGGQAARNKTGGAAANYTAGRLRQYGLRMMGRA